MGVRTIACILAVGGVLLLASSGSANETTTVRVSVDSAGNQSNNASEGASVSADGRYVAFISSATNLVPEDTNVEADVFVHDRQTGLTERVNVGEGGKQADGGSWGATLRHSVISDDGRYVAFNSSASNLVPAGDPGTVRVFLRDRNSQTTVHVASGEISDVSSDGRFVVYYNAGSTLLWDASTEKGEIIGRGGYGAVSADGRFVAFIDGRGIFLRDRNTETTRTIQAGMIGWPSISSDGRYIAFEWRFNDTSSDGTGVFIYDRDTDAVRQLGAGYFPKISAYGGHVVYTAQVDNQRARLRVVELRSGADAPIQTNAAAGCVIGAPQDISGDGRFVTFSSCTPDVVPNDTNECFFGGPGTCPDIFVHDRGEQPDAPTAPPIIDSPLPVLPSETPTATPCETPAETASPDAPTNETPSPDGLPGESSSPDPSADASQSTSATPSEPKEATQSPTPTYFPETSASSSPCSSEPLSADDTAETETSINTPRVAGVAAGAALLVGAASLGYLRLRRRR